MFQQYKQGIKWSAIGTAGTVALQMVQMVVFARLAGPREAGLFALAMTVAAFLSPFAEAGLGQAIIQAKDLQGRQVAVLGWLNFGIGAVILVICGVAAPWLGVWYQSPEVAPLIVFIAVPLLFMPFAVQYGGLLIRNVRFDQAARVELIASGLGFVVMLILAVRGYGAWAMAWSHVLKTLAACAGSWWYGRQHLHIPWRDPAPLRDALVLVRLGLFDLAARWTDGAVHYTDKLLVGKWLGTAALGIYNQAFSLYLLPITRLSSIITKVAFPVTARLQDDPAAVQAFFERASRQLMLVLLPIYGVMGVLAETIIVTLYGEQWLPAVPVLRILSVAGVVRTFVVLLPQVLRGLGRPQVYFFFLMALLTGGNAVLVLALTLDNSVNSAAWSRVATSLAVELPLAFWLARKCGISLRGVFCW